MSKIKKKSTQFDGFDEQTIQKLNKNLPISIRTLEPLIERISQQYNLIEKSEIILIVKTIVESIREIISKGDSITIYKFFTIFRLIRKINPRSGFSNTPQVNIVSQILTDKGLKK